MDDFSKLLSDITENPELVLTSQLTDEQILELQKRINPYSYVPNADPRNLIRRSLWFLILTFARIIFVKFAMTSLVGFIYKQLLSMKFLQKTDDGNQRKQVLILLYLIWKKLLVDLRIFLLLLRNL